MRRGYVQKDTTQIETTQSELRLSIKIHEKIEDRFQDNENTTLKKIFNKVKINNIKSYDLHTQKPIQLPITFRITCTAD